MKRLLIHLVGLALIVYYGLPYFIDGISFAEPKAAIIAAVLFAFINFAIKPILKIVTLPFNLLSFGLFGLVINVLLFWVVASVIDGFNVATLIDAFYGALALTIGNWILGKIAK